LRNDAIAVFATLITHKQISADEVFIVHLRELITSLPPLLEKIGCPSRNDSVTCRFSQHDYDDDVAFSHDFLRAFCFLLLQKYVMDECGVVTLEGFKKIIVISVQVHRHVEHFSVIFLVIRYIMSSPGHRYCS
uniref:MMS19 nucleotide excision repair protein n=1 Tax=Gongylonema pulchrum TaxID=637853 RepID=A0A183DLS1_9BILA